MRAAAPEAEEQLRLLTEEDPASRSEYELRRVLVYHRSQRVDLAQALVVTVDFAEIEDPMLLREVTDLLIEYGFLREAEMALAVVNRLEPADLLSWERRLSVLVTLSNESTLRALLRTLRTGEAGVTLRQLSNQSLDEHLDASYWRSIAGALARGHGALRRDPPAPCLGRARGRHRDLRTLVGMDASPRPFEARPSQGIRRSDRSFPRQGGRTLP
jgi:hypothetical protein